MSENGTSRGLWSAGLGPLFGLPLLVIGVTTIALLFAFFPGKQIGHALLGVPYGYGGDAMGAEALNQALLVQVVCLAMGFLFLGLAFGRIVEGSPLAWALWAANPITITIGCILYKLLHDALPLRLHSNEYTSPRSWFLLLFIAPIFFRYCCPLGAELAGWTRRALRRKAERRRQR